MATIRQRTSTATCAKCHKLFMPGDRVVWVFIVQKVDRNPVGRDIGAFVGEEFEMVHASCPDPGLEGKIIVP